MAYIALISALLLSIFISLPVAYAQDDRKCYWPDTTQVGYYHGLSHKLNYTFRPCDSEGESACCAEGEVCLTNGLCFGATVGSVYRGACTDRSWNSAACPQYCDIRTSLAFRGFSPCV